VVEPLDRDGDSPRSGKGEAPGLLPDGTQTASTLVARRDGLRVPGERLDPLLLCDEAGDLPVRAPRRAPLIEHVEPLLPAAPGPPSDRLVGGREHPLPACLRLRGREQGGPRRRKALARLRHPRADEPLKGSLLGHFNAPSTRRRRTTHARGTPPERAQMTGVPRARAPFAPATAGGVSAGTEG